MADTEHREQHNHGSGTFVGGDVHGGLWQVFLPPYGKKTSGNPAPTKRQPEQDDEDDYEGALGSLIVAAWVSASAGLAVVYAVMGWPWTDHEPAPGIAARIGGGLVAFYACLAAAAAFFARLAQVFEALVGAMCHHGCAKPRSVGCQAPCVHVKGYGRLDGSRSCCSRTACVSVRLVLLRGRSLATRASGPTQRSRQREFGSRRGEEVQGVVTGRGPHLQLLAGLLRAEPGCFSTALRQLPCPLHGTRPDAFGLRRSSWSRPPSKIRNSGRSVVAMDSASAEWRRGAALGMRRTGRGLRPLGVPTVVGGAIGRLRCGCPQALET